MEAPPIAVLTPYIENFYDEETGMTIIVHVLCPCGLPMARINEEHYGCPHCDKPCHNILCEECKNLYEFDYYNEFEYNEDEEEE